MPNIARIIQADLRFISTTTRRKIRPALTEAAKPIVADAKSRASWSTRIPGAIRVSVLKRGVDIKVSRKKAPHARPYEGIGGGSKFRHPVFGHRSRWVSQKTRPFIQPAVRANKGKVRRELEQIVIDAARDRGFS